MSIAKAHWRLWYDRPAEEWTEALPLGNGKIGGMIYGGIHEERIGLNEETVWSGKPHFDASPGVLQTINQVRNLLLKEITRLRTPSTGICGRYFDNEFDMEYR